MYNSLSPFVCSCVALFGVTEGAVSLVNSAIDAVKGYSGFCSRAIRGVYEGAQCNRFATVETGKNKRPLYERTL